MVVNSKNLNERWLDKIRRVLESLRLTFADYAKLAGENDKTYQKFSPFHLSNTQQAQPLLSFEEFGEEAQRRDKTEAQVQHHEGDVE